jgi:hypothetical protein
MVGMVTVIYAVEQQRMWTHISGFETMSSSQVISSPDRD